MTLADSDNWSKLVEFAQQKQEAAKCPGLALGVLHDEESAAAGFGVTNRDHPLVVDDHTLFQIGSITKTFTATAIMRLVEAGRVDLDAKVRIYLPEFKVMDDEATRKATIRHLLTHVGGWAGDVFRDTGMGDDALTRYVALMAEQEQVTPLGQLYSYNNASFSIAGAVIEAVTGSRYEDAMRELVLDPLGMETCFFDPADVMTQRFAVGHGGPDKAVARPWALPRSVYPAGGIICHVPDLLGYARFHMGDGTDRHGKQILDESCLLAMQTPEVLIWGKASVGLAWHIDDALGPRSVNHGGGTVGQETSLTLLPERRFAVAVFTNCSGGSGPARAITDEAIKLFLALEKKDRPKARNASVEELAQFVGRYERPAADMELGILNGRLIGQFKDRVGFPTEKDDPGPPPPPAALDLCEPDRLIILDGAWKNGTADVIRNPDGTVGYIRLGGRLHRRV